MSAEIHHLPAGDEDEGLPLAPSGSVYLDAYLEPFRRWLERDAKDNAAIVGSVRGLPGGATRQASA